MRNRLFDKLGQELASMHGTQHMSQKRADKPDC